MSRGHQRERDLVHELKAAGWIAFRAPASLGVADVVALRADRRPMMIEVKSTAQGPYERFGPADRAALSDAADAAGADPFLVHWPAYGQQKWIPPADWP